MPSARRYGSRESSGAVERRRGYQHKKRGGRQHEMRPIPPNGPQLDQQPRGAKNQRNSFENGDGARADVV